jgi:acetyl esterase/lipase
MEESHHFNPIATFLSERDTNTTGVNHSTQPSSDQSRSPQKIVITTESGETIEVDEQLHFYAPNSLLSHPLISPINSYLGGLPPLLFIAGDKEVLRDEIIFWYVGSHLVYITRLSHLVLSNLAPIKLPTLIDFQ